MSKWSKSKQTQLLNAGTLALESEKYDGAEAAFAEVLRYDENNLQGRIGMGQVHEAKGEYEQALEQYQRVIELAPDNPAGYTNSGDVYLALHQYDDALKAYAQAIERMSEPSFGYWKRGNVFAEQQQYDKAVEMYRKALDHNPENTEAWYSLGMVYELIEKFEQALDCYDKLISLGRANSVAYYARAGIYLILQRYEQALLDYDKVVEIDGGVIDGYWGRGLVYAEQEAYIEAIAEFSKAIELEPTIPIVYNARGKMYFNQEKYTQAQKDYCQAAELARSQRDNEQEIVALKGRILSLYFKEDYEELLMTLDRALVLDPKNVWVLNFKGNVLSEFAYNEDAVPLLERAASLDLSKHDNFSSIGWAFNHIGRAAEARHAYETAISLQEEDLWAHKGLANALDLLGETEAATDKYRYVIEKAEMRDLVSADDRSLIGWCQYKLGQYEEAEKIFEQSLSLNPNIISTWFDLALSQMCGEKYSLGLLSYQRTLEMVARKHVLKRRGLLYVAMYDLKRAVTTEMRLTTVKEVQQAMNLLEMAWEQAKNNAASISVRTKLSA